MNHYKAALQGWQILLESQAFGNFIVPVLCFGAVCSISGLIAAWALVQIAEAKQKG